MIKPFSQFDYYIQNFFNVLHAWIVGIFGGGTSVYDIYVHRFIKL